MANDNSPVLGGSVQYVDTAPSGACSLNAPIQVVKGTGVIYTCDNGTWASQGGGGGTGTVTSVSVTTANGVSGSVADPTTTPAISLALGSITPSAVNVSGLTASQLVQTDASKNLASSNTLPNGVVATTQSANDNSTKVATTAYVDGKTSGNYVNIGSLVTLTNATYSNGLITGGTTPSSITISAIPGTYLHLEIQFDGTVSGSGLSGLIITFNSDTGSHYLFGRSGTNMVAGTASTGNSGALTTGIQAALLGGTNEPVGACCMKIGMYAQAHRKVIHVLNVFGDTANAAGQVEGNGYWNQTTAITSITFTPGAGTFGTGALITIHGIN